MKLQCKSVVYFLSVITTQPLPKKVLYHMPTHPPYSFTNVEIPNELFKFGRWPHVRLLLSNDQAHILGHYLELFASGILIVCMQL